jgi:hypothetical protein
MEYQAERTIDAQPHTANTRDLRAASNAPRPRSKSGNPPSKSIVLVFALVLVAGIAFFGGMQYQKSHGTSSLSANATGGFGGQGSTTGASGSFGGPGGNAQMGSFGTVTAISSDSISVKDQRTSSVKTYSITSATTVTDDGSTSTVSAIAVGDSIMVQSSSSSSTTASTINLNPTMGGPGGASTTAPTSSSTTTTH